MAAAQDTAAATVEAARPTVRLIDPGTEPRRELRYRLGTGQTDRFVATTSVASRVQPPEQTWPEPLALRAAVEQTVIDTEGEGVYELETVYTDVELVRGADGPVFAADRNLVRALAGTTIRQSVDDRGWVLSSETIAGPDWAATGIHLGIMPGLIDVTSLQLSRMLPDEPVGIGAVWQVASEIRDPVEGLPLAVVVTTTLEDLRPDGDFDLSGKGRLGAPLQRLTTTPTGDYVALTIRTTGDLSATWTVDPRSFVPDGRISVEVDRTTTPTAKGVEPTTIDMRMESITERPTAASAQDPSEPPSFGGCVEVPGRGVAIAFPEDWLTFDLASDIDARARRIEAVLGDVFPVGREALVADLERRSHRSEVLALSLAGEAGP